MVGVAKVKPCLPHGFGELGPSARGPLSDGFESESAASLHSHNYIEDLLGRLEVLRGEWHLLLPQGVDGFLRD
jgi:hypothetical protein